MDYVNLGRTGLKVSRVCLGTAFRATLFKPDYDEAFTARTIHRALDLGVDFIDTANYYSYGRSEETLGRALKGKRDDVVLATKVAVRVKDDPKPNDEGLSRYHIMREVERSLARLQTDHIDLYWLHTPDDSTPIDETLRAMDDLVHQGKVRYIGCCNFLAWQLTEALWRSDALRLNSFAAIQNQYHLLNRAEIEPELMPVCRKYGLGIATYSPLAIGLLTGRFRRGVPPPKGTPWAPGGVHAAGFEQALSARADSVVQALIAMAAPRHCTPGQVAMAWILDHAEVSSIIIGPDAPEHVDEAVGALAVKLTREERAQLDALSAEPQTPKFS